MPHLPVIAWVAIGAVAVVAIVILVLRRRKPASSSGLGLLDK